MWVNCQEESCSVLLVLLFAFNRLMCKCRNLTVDPALDFICKGSEQLKNEQYFLCSLFKSSSYSNVLLKNSKIKIQTVGTATKLCPI